jgi:hypothetical protein
MKQPFEIKFDFPLAHSEMIFTLKATAEVHHSEPYYVIDNIHVDSNGHKKQDPSILPQQEIKQIKRGKSKVWVHRDSERESLLSLAAGKAIENKLKRYNTNSR